MNSFRNLLALGFFFCAACTSGNKTSEASDEASKVDSAAVVSPVAEVKEEEPPLRDDEQRELGLLKIVDDAGYPFAVLTIEFPERKFTEYFTINFEEVKDADLQKVYDWKGKYVAFRYTSKLEDALLDIKYNGKSLMGADSLKDLMDIQTIKGILKGADEETPGDLPGTVTITSADKKTKSFEFFVTREMVDVNGSTVVGYYEPRPTNVITAIKLASK